MGPPRPHFWQTAKGFGLYWKPSFWLEGSVGAGNFSEGSGPDCTSLRVQDCQPSRVARQSWRSLALASEELQGDGDLVLEAVAQALEAGAVRLRGANQTRAACFRGWGRRHLPTSPSDKVRRLFSKTGFQEGFVQFHDCLWQGTFRLQEDVASRQSGVSPGFLRLHLW